MKHFIFGFTLLLSAMLWGCTPTRSYVVLLPDADGKVGTLHMKTDSGVYKVDQAYHAVRSEGQSEASNAAQSVEKRQIEAIFGRALEAEPDQQFRFDVFTFHCVMNSAELTPESQKRLPALIEHLKDLNPQEIYVVGHTDRVGTEKYNAHLSGKRSSLLERFLVSQGITTKIIAVYNLGESKPLVNTKDEIDEPLNRRVEIITKTPRK